MRRNAYGFEIDKTFYRRAKDEMLTSFEIDQMNILDIEAAGRRDARQQMKMEY